MPLYTNYRGTYLPFVLGELAENGWSDFKELDRLTGSGRTLPYKHLVNTARFSWSNGGLTILVHLQEELSNSHKMNVAITRQFFPGRLRKMHNGD